MRYENQNEQAHNEIVTASEHLAEPIFDVRSEKKREKLVR